MRIEVDLTTIPRRIVHADLKIPAAPGPLTLYYPKWMPGDHGPTGPIDNLAGIFFRAGGKDLAWTRGPEDMYVFKVVVPEGAGEVDVALDYLMPPEPEGNPEGASASEKLAIFNWSHVLLMPSPRGDDVMVEADLKAPEGWTVMPVLEKKPVSLTTLIDSPVLAGKFTKTIALDPHVFVDLAADAPADLAMPETMITALKKLVRETDAVFAPRPFKDYHFLVALSSQVSRFSVEHQASSDNRFRERTLIDDDMRRVAADTLSHEYVHAWNGKYRRPAGLRPGDFETPIDSSLLWVYEGLSQYYGWVLAARSGELKKDEALDTLAVTAAEQETRAGRRWRDLVDTGRSAQLLYYSPDAWTSWRRATDFYDEGALLWLDVDVAIRKLTKGTRTLDDFCRRFFAGAVPMPPVKTYEIGDVIVALNAVALNDWAAFLDARVHAHGEHAPLGGVEGAGWTLAWAEKPSPLMEATATVSEVVDLRYSIGLVVETSGTIADVIPDSPAWKAGLAPGMKIVAVDERRFTKEGIDDAVRAGKDAAATIAFLVENADYFRTIRVETRGGARFPVLSRAKGSDLLEAILAPRARTP
ncbi:MAG TPA: hypothetical protein VFV19_00445 [Candidatus Polarisedimenticolaceae bacterium]|nr:hypothetical protein [Candidatus Polarisedimenticolaceae bacterium]